MLSLTDFLNHGLLPFVGRSHEIDTLMDFWRSSIDVGGLRLAIITGEAGSGKTRLLDQLLPRIAREGGMVVRARLYPDSTISVAPLMAQALGKSGIAFRLLKVAPEGTIADVVTTFRRVARLRPVVLMIEDLHLLQGEALQELGVLLHTLSDEDLTVLCAARKMELSVRGVLEPYSVLEVELSGLEQEAMEKMWETLFGADPGETTIETILDVTLGNPLAIRSALRGAISSGMIAPDASGEDWEVQAERDPFAHALRQGVRVLSEGLAAQLTESEREDGAQLACLGEIFSREAATTMIDDAETVIERLLYKGLLIITDMPSQPLAGTDLVHLPTSQHPLLAFTHSLVHRQFVEGTTVNAGRLIRVIGMDLPLYSILPFELVAGSTTAGDFPTEIGAKAFARAMRVIHSLDFSPDRHLAMTFWRAGSAILDMLWERLTPLERRLRRADLIFHKLAILRHSPLHPEHQVLIADLFEVTAEPTPQGLLLFRMRAFAYQAMIGAEVDAGFAWHTWDQVEGFISRYPEMRYHASYVHYLHVVAHWGSVRRNVELLRMVETHLEGLMSSEGATDMFRRGVRDLIARFLLLDFSTEEELERRRKVLAETEENPANKRDISFLAIKLDMHEMLGEIEQVQQLCDYLRSRTSTSNPRAFLNSSHTRVRSLVSRGTTVRELQEESERLIAEAPDWYRDAYHTYIAHEMVKVGVLAGEIVWAGEIARTFCENELTDLLPGLLLLLALFDGSGRAIPEPSGEAWAREPMLAALTGAVLRGEHPGEALLADLRDLLRRSPLHDEQLLQRHALFALIERAGCAAELRTELAMALTLTLEWLVAHKLFVYMRALTNRYEHYLGSREVKEWRRRIVEIEREISAQRKQEEPSQQVIVAMLGTIEVTLPQQEPVRPRGSRLRLFLGLLVADAIMKRQLSFQEMCAIVSTDASGERCRKALNEAVYRLRELLGHDAVITEEETPRLNRLLVEVDLIEAYDRLRGAATALVSGSLLQAHRSLLSALKLTRGEVPFPGLYEDFFEHAREEFDYLLRSTLIGVGRGLLSEGDLESAEELLERGYESIPEDEEIAGLLSQTYERMGRKASAERVRARSGG